MPHATRNVTTTTARLEAYLQDGGYLGSQAAHDLALGINHPDTQAIQAL
jgi:hypothetical protein